MNRYFAKIDEKENIIDWEIDRNCQVFITYKLDEIKFFDKWLHSYGDLFAVLESTDNEKRFKVLLLSDSPEGMKEYFKLDEFSTESAYYWGANIGDRDIMIDRIADSQYAYYWARDIGNEDVMIDRITDSIYALYWAKDIGDKDIMIHKVTDHVSAMLWRAYLGDAEIMDPIINRHNTQYHKPPNDISNEYYTLPNGNILYYKSLPTIQHMDIQFKVVYTGTTS